MTIPLDPPTVASPFAAWVLEEIDPLVTSKEYTQPMVLLEAQVFPSAAMSAAPALVTLRNTQSIGLLKISVTGEHVGITSS
jgi:hypothetical protein